MVLSSRENNSGTIEIKAGGVFEVVRRKVTVQ